MAARLDGGLSDSMSRNCDLSERFVHSERVVHLEQLPADALGAVWGAVDHDDAFAASLVCSKLNAARAGVPIRTRICSSLRSSSLRQWADAHGCPPPYPYWVELHGLRAASAALYNGRCGLVLQPPNSVSGRVPVEVDGGLGECATGRRDAVRILVKPANTRPLTELGSELILAVRLLTSPGGWSRRQVSLPRDHSCFLREAVLLPNNSTLSQSEQTTLWLQKKGFGINVRNGQLSGKTVADMRTISALTPSVLGNTGNPDQVLATLSAMRERAQREAYREQLQPLLTQSQPLPSARWANVERPQLMTVLGVPLAAQRLEARSSRGRGEMGNHLASILMADTDGSTGEDWRGGVGEVLVYRCPTPSTGAVTSVDHLTGFDMEIVISFLENVRGHLSEDPVTPDNLNEHRQRWKSYEYNRQKDA
jgi:hypothetical protein